MTSLVGLLVRDMPLTGDEEEGLKDGMLTSRDTQTSTTRLIDRLNRNTGGLGRRHESELGRNWRKGLHAIPAVRCGAR